MKIGITGQAGFVGTYLFNTLNLNKQEFECVPFEDDFFKDNLKLKEFVRHCDVIVHLAAMNRHSNPQFIYETNIKLVKKLVVAMEQVGVVPHVLFSSSTQEKKENEYGKSKKEGRELLEQWAQRNNASFTGLVVPNVYGPFGKPNYNSFIATFCYNLINGNAPEIIQDSVVDLIYVGNLCKYIIERVREVEKQGKSITQKQVPSDFNKKVTEVLFLLQTYKDLYYDKGIIPNLFDTNELNLFNTFRSYIDCAKHFPVQLMKHADERGTFVETVRLGIGGQVSFSTTIPGITRGEHYHTRKIERFTVVQGKAKIQIRKVGTNDIISYLLDGENPSYVDMPIWYTHNITNVGEGELLTQFWISEWYNSDDTDTYYEKV